MADVIIISSKEEMIESKLRLLKRMWENNIKVKNLKKILFKFFYKYLF